MKKYLYFNLIFLFVIISSCSNKTSIQSSKDEIQRGDTINKKILIEFNTDAVNSRGEYLIFKINDDFDFKNLTLLVNSKKTTNQTHRVVADSIQKNVSFKFFLKDNAAKGSYNFSVEVIDQSDGLTEVGSNNPIIYDGSSGFTKTEYVYPETTLDKILFYLKIIGIILFVIFIIYFILSRDNMPLGKKTFFTGMIAYPDGQLSSVRLEGINRYGYNISSALGIDPGINLQPYDRFYNKKKRRFARLKNTSNAEIIIIYDDIQESMGNSQDLFNMDEIKIKTLDNKLFILNYVNKKNLRVT